MKDRKYSKDHEWVFIENNIATVGITDHAQESLGDIVFVELPEIGKNVSSGNEVSVIESVKAASDIFAPIDGKIIETNKGLTLSDISVNVNAKSTFDSQNNKKSSGL